MRRFTVPAMLTGQATARMIDQDVPHHPRCDGEEVRAVLPVHGPLIDQSHVRFVHERRRLECLAAFAGKVPAGNPSKLLVNERCQTFKRHLVTPSPGDEEFSELVRFTI
jgi:hypothetical protein